MSKRIRGPLVGVLTVVTIGVAGSGCRQDSESEPEPSVPTAELGLLFVELAHLPELLVPE